MLPEDDSRSMPVSDGIESPRGHDGGMILTVFAMVLVVVMAVGPVVADIVP